MEITRFTVGAFHVNTYLIQDSATGDAAIVDTGETDALLQTLKAMTPEPRVKMILLTHAHIDHAGAIAELQAHFEAETYLGQDDRMLFDLLPEQPKLFGFPGPPLKPGVVHHWLNDGDRIQLGETTLHYLATPGHTPGQGCFYDDTDIFVGDTLFAGSIGRTDFPLSEPDAMIQSLRRLMQLPGELRVHSGHGPDTTLAEELHENPFLGYLRPEHGLPRGPSIPWADGL